MMMMMMIESMGRDCVSELLPSTGLIFIPQVIYEQVEPWWNDIDRENLVIRPSDISGNPTSSHIIAKQGNWRR
jgi:hypothetical protein